MIRSTFYGFGIAMSGLNVAQKALDLTGNNMVNLNTPGYTRQRLDLYSIPSANYADRYASTNPKGIGQGVDVTRVSQIRDPFLDNRFRREASTVGELDAYMSSISEISRIFDETQNLALKATLSDFYTQLQVYSGSPSSIEIESTVRAAAESVLRMFNQYGKDLANVRQEQEYLLNDITIPKINTILENIALLNKNIRECEIYGNPALELKDQRNLLIDELSTYMKIDVSYEKDEKFPAVDILRITMLGNDGLNRDQRMLVHGKEYATFDAYKDGNGVMHIVSDKALDPNVPVDPSDPNDPGTPISLKFTAGALKGVLNMLNSNGEFDNPPNTTRGIGFYEKILDTIVKDFAETLNEANKVKNPLFDPDFDPPDKEFIDRPLFEASDGSGVINAENIVLASGWVRGDYGLTYTRFEAPGGGTIDVSGGTDNILNLISLLDKKFNFTTGGLNGGGNHLYTGSFQEVFSNIGNIAAIDAKSKSSALDSSIAVITGIEDMRNSVSSVSMDEEGINLLRYQKSYAAAARVITTLDEALDVLINRMGVVGR